MSKTWLRRLDTKAADFDVALESLLHRNDPFDATVVKITQGIIADVRDRGDAALCEYTARFDDFKVLDAATLEISSSAREEAFQNLPSSLRQSLEAASKRIQDFHEHQKTLSWEYDDGCGSRLGQRLTPLERIGVYVPGGKAAYPSSILMSAIPARIAGVNEIIMVVPTPRGEDNNLVLAASHLAQVDRVFRIGGPQAVAALAVGTKTVPRVDKIVGPGNRYVQAAKKLVFGSVNIDMIAGPSEVAIIADETCDPSWIAADLLAQAEHDESAGVWLICWSESLMAMVFDQIQMQLESLDRNAIARMAIDTNAVGFIVANENAAVELVNHIAPEHVEVLMEEPDCISDRIQNAGAVFIGRYSPTVIGDYFAGPNHVLPTARTSRFFSPLGVYDFLKRTNIIRYSEEAIERSQKMIEQFAIAEGLTGHARSLTIRNH